jgi:hypothetical protein
VGRGGCVSGYGRWRSLLFVLACSLSFLGGGPHFWAIVFDRGPLGSTWWQCGHWSWALCVVCGRGVVGGVVVVLVEENKSCHKL